MKTKYVSAPKDAIEAPADCNPVVLLAQIADAKAVMHQYEGRWYIEGAQDAKAVEAVCDAHKPTDKHPALAAIEAEQAKVAADKQSGIDKLLALGLTKAEIDALVG